MDPRDVRAAGAVVTRKGGQVLLVHRPKYDDWSFPKGKLDPGEHHVTAAVREVAEETGLDARAPGHVLSDWGLENVYEIYPQWRHRYAPGVTHNTEHLFGLCVPAPRPVRLSPREHRDQCWLPWQQAMERCFSSSNAEAIGWLPRLGGLRRQ